MKILNKLLLSFGIAALILALLPVSELTAQEVQGPHKLKWIKVGTLQNWFSNCGAEVEYGRRGRACCQELDQTDQYYWDALYEFQDRKCSQGFWFGCVNFQDQTSGKTYDHKIISSGSRFADMLTQTMNEKFVMKGKFPHPQVFVDNLPASDNDMNDVVDVVDETIKADRQIEMVLHTPMGISMTKTIYGFSQQYNDNYFIFDYVLKNTGIVDLEGTIINRTIDGFYFHLEERYAPGYTAFRGGWPVSGNLSWGSNTVHQVIGQNPGAPDFKYRAYYSWYQPHSSAPSYESDWGAPDHNGPRVLGAPAFIGGLTLHCDTSPTDQTDDLWQPSGSQIIDSDDQMTSNIDQYNAGVMTKKYLNMSSGHPEQTHAEIVGEQFGDIGSSFINGCDQSQNYGPYTLAPGDSIHIVVAEGAAGINRQKSYEIGYNWFYENAPFDMPDGSTTNDRDEYKRAWVWTAEDSIMQMYERAKTNYESGFDIPQPPPPPQMFNVQSGGDKITITWAENATEYEHFDGYKLFRAVNRPDTLYEMIFSCDASNAVHQFEDKTAQRGFDYYYYIQTKDDGSLNNVEPGVPLVSSKFWTVTNTPAYLRRPAIKTTLDSIIVVPNPYHIEARSLQFGVDVPDRLAFFGLPPVCTIKIYTERGDLVDKIEHMDGSGDELWDSVTSSNQIVVSGIYIAYFEVPEDIQDEETGELLFAKGASAFRKFVVIR